MNIHEKNINELRYADDTVIIADSPEALERLIIKLVEKGNQKGMKINVGIFCMVVERVDRFIYLGS